MMQPIYSQLEDWHMPPPSYLLCSCTAVCWNEHPLEENANDRVKILLGTHIYAKKNTSTNLAATLALLSLTIYILPNSECCPTMSLIHYSQSTVHSMIQW